MFTFTSEILSLRFHDAWEACRAIEVETSWFHNAENFLLLYNSFGQVKTKQIFKCIDCRALSSYEGLRNVALILHLLAFSYLWHSFKYILFPIKGDTKPTITPARPHIVVQLNEPFKLHCQGENRIQWKRERSKLPAANEIDGMLTYSIKKALPSQMGRYICQEEGSKEEASIYVYVKGT